MIIIILGIWAAAAVAGTVTAVVCFKKRKPQEAICDTCEYLQIRNDHNNPKEGTTWICCYGRGGRFTDPPEYCKAYKMRSKSIAIYRQEQPNANIVMSATTAQQLINEGVYANLATMAQAGFVTHANLETLAEEIRRGSSRG